MRALAFLQPLAACVLALTTVTVFSGCSDTSQEPVAANMLSPDAGDPDGGKLDAGRSEADKGSGAAAHPAAPGCSNGRRDEGELCDPSVDLCCNDTCDGVKARGKTCREAHTGCDVAEVCDGSSAGCPDDAVAATTVVCRPAAGPCDVAESCDGRSAVCPKDVLQPNTVTCREAAGECDVAEQCNGSDAACPSDTFKPASVECRAANGVCDVAEQCTGTGAACPTDAFASAHTVCRDAVDPCDMPETCSGSATTCPANVRRAAGDACGSNADCVVQQCNASGVCVAAKNEADGTACAACNTLGTCSSGACGTTAQNVFFADFSSANGWTLGSEWAIGPTKQSQGCVEQGAPAQDPAQDHTPNSNNNVAGMGLGACISAGLTSKRCLVSPIVDATAAGGDSLQLSYWRWLNADYDPYARSNVEVFDGKNWMQLFTTVETATNDQAWTLQTFDISSVRNAKLQVRWCSEGITPDASAVAGWNVDDVGICVSQSSRLIDDHGVKRWPQTCAELKAGDAALSDGVYVIDPDGLGGRGAFAVFCDMTTAGGGWTRVGFEPATQTSHLQFLGVESGTSDAVAYASDAGLFGVRLKGQYSEIALTWGDNYIRAKTATDIFANTVDTAIPLSMLQTSDSTLAGWAAADGGATFCRASRASDVRPGDSSWAVKPKADANTACGCSGVNATGEGAFYGGAPTMATQCAANGGGWAGVRADKAPKGGIASVSDFAIWVR